MFIYLFLGMGSLKILRFKLPDFNLSVYFFIGELNYYLGSVLKICFLRLCILYFVLPGVILLKYYIFNNVNLSGSKCEQCIKSIKKEINTHNPTTQRETFGYILLYPLNLCLFYNVEIIQHVQC